MNRSSTSAAVPVSSRQSHTRVLGCLHQHPTGLSAREISRQTGIRNPEVNRSLYALFTDRQVTYRMNNDGVKFWSLYGEESKENPGDNEEEEEEDEQVYDIPPGPFVKWSWPSIHRVPQPPSMPPPPRRVVAPAVATPEQIRDRYLAQLKIIEDSVKNLKRIVSDHFSHPRRMETDLDPGIRSLQQQVQSLYKIHD